jgi:hypothetical protein
MTSLTISASCSAGVFLFGDDSVAELSDRLTQAGTLDKAQELLDAVGGGVWSAARKQLTSMISGFLDLDLASVAVSGWCKHRELVDVAERLDGTAASAVVPLWTQDICLTEKPRIDLVVGGATAAVIQFELKVEIKVIGVAGVVRGGALVALEGGRCEVTVSFSAAGACLGKRTADFDPHRAIPLGKGISLVPRPRAETSPALRSAGAGR